MQWSSTIASCETYLYLMKIPELSKAMFVGYWLPCWAPMRPMWTAQNNEIELQNAKRATSAWIVLRKLDIVMNRKSNPFWLSDERKKKYYSKWGQVNESVMSKDHACEISKTKREWIVPACLCVSARVNHIRVSLNLGQRYYTIIYIHYTCFLQLKLRCAISNHSFSMNDNKLWLQVLESIRQASKATRACKTYIKLKEEETRQRTNDNQAKRGQQKKNESKIWWAMDGWMSEWENNAIITVSVLSALGMTIIKIYFFFHYSLHI